MIENRNVLLLKRYIWQTRARQEATSKQFIPLVFSGVTVVITIRKHTEGDRNDAYSLFNFQPLSYFIEQFCLHPQLQHVFGGPCHIDLQNPVAVNRSSLLTVRQVAAYQRLVATTNYLSFQKRSCGRDLQPRIHIFYRRWRKRHSLSARICYVQVLHVHLWHPAQLWLASAVY